MAIIKWFGHACFQLEMANKIILIDPWLNGNPISPIKSKEIKKADIVCVTHDHMDHLGNAFEICKATNATFVSNFEIGLYAEKHGLKSIVGMNIGGTVSIDNIQITMVQAFHSSNRGSPCGFIIKNERKSIYHAGDTGLFGDMKLIGKLYKPDVALIPIGGYYTMGPIEAVEAVELINPKTVIPMHYMTFPILEPSPERFIKALKEKGMEVNVMSLKPGNSYTF
ncbi:MAG: metal-dependent hydrolase [Candidatus Bathyarchaeia archaeon]